MRRQASFPERRAVDHPGAHLPGIYGAKVIQVLPATGRAITKLLVDGSHTIECRIMTAHANAASGLLWLPQVDDLVAVAFLQGHKGLPVILGSFYDDTDVPPTQAAGEMALKHQSGTLLKVKANGDVELNHKDGPLVTVTGDQVKLQAGSTTLRIGPGGDVKVSSATTIELDGTVALARHGDLTSVVAGHAHTIIASSTKLKGG
jgi:uncharacterized protein involved in type VI secretion and phage assembly